MGLPTYWWFSDVSKKLMDPGKSSTKKRVADVGVTHTEDCVPVPGLRGLHAGPTIIDALQGAPGPFLWQVTLGGVVVHDRVRSKTESRLLGRFPLEDAKISSASERTYNWGADVSDVLMKYARVCALDTIDQWDASDTVREFLETGNPDLKEAVRIECSGKGQMGAAGYIAAALRAEPVSVARCATSIALKYMSKEELHTRIWNLTQEQ